MLLCTKGRAEVVVGYCRVPLWDPMCPDGVDYDGHFHDCHIVASTLAFMFGTLT